MYTPDDSDIGYFLEVDLSCPCKTKEKTKGFTFCHEDKETYPDDFTPYMIVIKPDNYTQNKKKNCDWTDKKVFISLKNVKTLYYIWYGI